MHSALTTLVTLMISPNSLWIDESSQQCLQQIEAKFFTGDSLLLMGDVTFPKLFTKPVYISSTPARYAQFEVVLVYKRLSDWPVRKLHGRVILLTQSLEMIDTLWTQFRILHLVVILQKTSECEVYTWYPYKPENCQSTPVLQLIDTWRDNQFQNNTDFKLNHLPQHFGNCPLKSSVAICPPFVGRNGQGPEAEILADLLASVGLKPLRVKIPSYVGYFTEPKSDGTIAPDSVFDLLTNQNTEIATTCLVKTIENIEFDSLPSHLTDYGVWHLPGPTPIAMRFGFAQALSLEIWTAILASFLASVIFLFIVVRSKSFGFIFCWMTARLLSLPYPELSKRTSLRLFSIILELSILVISAIYRSLLLLNLFITPVFRFHSAQEGADYGLTAFIRTLDAQYINQSNHDFWNQILKPGRNIQALQFNYKELIFNKAAMVLGRRIVDRALIFEQFPSIVYEDEVYVSPDVFRIINLVFMLRPHHPLTPLFTIKMLNIIEVGIPEHYILEAFNKIPHKYGEGHDDEDRALKMKQLGALFFFEVILLMFCSVVFIMEVLVGVIRRQKKTPLSLHRRHDQRLQILNSNREH